MAALPAGVQYGLSSESSYNENKDLVFVKLTDSALKAIEDFIRNSRGKLGASPTIQFLPGNEGKISIPGGNNGQQTAIFHFSLSGNADMEGPQGSFECVRSDGARRLETCGPLPRKMRVHAKEDVYEATRHRMAATDAEQKSKRTQEIKPNQTDIGRKVKVRHSLVGGSRAPRAPAARIAPAAPPAPAPVAPAPPPAPAPAAHSPTPRAQPPRAPPPNANPDLMRRPIKERLIQLLALRPYKKPELYSRITSEGIREKERGVINNILQQISCLKDNCYQLHRHIWNDVNEDWPFYTEEEKQLLKRRKPQNLTPPLSSDSGQSLSPRGSPGAKRVPPVAEGAPAAKKQRISHYKKPSTPNATDLNSSRRCSPTASSGYHTSGGSSGASSGASSGERQASDEEPPAALTAHHHRAAQQVKKDNGYPLNFNAAKSFCTSPVKQNGFRTSPSTEQIPPEKDTRPVNLENDVGMPDANLAEDDIDSINIEREYPAISSGTARRRYKAEFGAQYAEYRTLYGRVDAVARLFTKLEHRLRRSQPGSQQYQETKQEIVEEYERMQRDAGYQRDRARFTYLHRKLTHIKRMVADYDSRRATQSPSQSMSARTGTEAY